MRCLFTFLCVCTLGVVSLAACSETNGDGGSGGSAGSGGTGGTDLCEGVDCDDGNECTTDACSPTDGSCGNTALDDGSFCEAGYCESGECAPLASIFPCTEQGIRDAIATGGGPHGFACDGPTMVTTMAEIAIDNDVILDGRDNLTVDGNDDHPVFSAPVDTVAELRRFAVTGGFSEGDLSGNGGGIANAGTLSLANSTVSENSTGETGGGGIWNGGTMTVSNSTVSGNSAGIVGFGGIWNGGTMTVSNSTVSGNSAGAFGVNGIFNDGSFGGSVTLTLANTTVSENTGGKFGGVFNSHGTLTVTNSTVSGNTAEWSGGIFNGGPAGGLTITNSTVSGNTAESGASIVNVSDLAGSAVLTIANSLVDGDCVGWREGLPQGAPDITSNGYNIESPSNTCGFDQGTDKTGVPDLMLGPLQNNGGPTDTHALLPGSNAINQIPEAACEVDEDQRGVARPQGPTCDVGAFEVEVAP